MSYQSDQAQHESYSKMIGQLVLSRRTALGLSQLELANQAHTTQARISHIEGGEINVTTNTLNRVFHVLGLLSLSAVYETENSEA